MEHFYHNRIRFAAVAVTPAGRSPVGPSPGLLAAGCGPFSTRRVLGLSGSASENSSLLPRYSCIPDVMPLAMALDSLWRRKCTSARR